VVWIGTASGAASEVNNDGDDEFRRRGGAGEDRWPVCQLEIISRVHCDVRRLVLPEDSLLGESPTEVEALLALLCLLLGDSISISNFIRLILTLSGVPISWC